VADRLALALVGAQGSSAIARVQFHPSTSYEDFVQGFRPDGNGGFVLRDGPFVRFCNAAKELPDIPHVFIIDELNRGNLSRIFGELMMLIETDKRGRKWEMALTYAPQGAKAFYVPENVYVIGLMNTADRSLAMIDYALRRRFSFFTLAPAFSADAFEATLLGRGVTEVMVGRIRNKMEKLNKLIVGTPALGVGYAVGHSYFVDGPTEGEDEEDWFNRVIAYEIAPLLEEYCFDAPETAAQWRKLLEAD
jgi:5-methylcytosine-specific restriction endonuclease McrBC GTP-binding regulatory subunit McrB